MGDPRILRKEWSPKPSCESLCLKKNNLSTYRSPLGEGAEMKYNNE